MFEFTSISDEPVGIIGAGAAGLVTAQVLLGDGFTNVQLVTRDESVGGIWAKERIYPGMFLNKYVYPISLEKKTLYLGAAFMANFDFLQ